MQTDNPSYWNRAKDPIIQALLALGSVLLVIMVSELIDLTGLLSVEEDFPWLTAASFLLFFAVFSSIASLMAQNRQKYWGRSMYSFIGLALGSGLLAWGFSSLSIGQAGSYRWIFIVVSFCYLVFMSLINLMRTIVDFAQKEEWTHPRLRNRK